MRGKGVGSLCGTDKKKWKKKEAEKKEKDSDSIPIARDILLETYE